MSDAGVCEIGAGGAYPALANALIFSLVPINLSVREPPKSHAVKLLYDVQADDEEYRLTVKRGGFSNYCVHADIASARHCAMAMQEDEADLVEAPCQAALKALDR